MNWRTMLYTITVSVIVAGVLAACAAPAAPASAPAADTAADAAPADAASGEAATITVSGAFALFPLMTLWAEEYSKINPNVQFDVQAGGAGKGMTDMLSGAADIAMLSREPRQEELDQGSFLVAVTIDSVIGTFNANNPYAAELQAQGITAEEANAIWITPTITTWSQLLGVDGDEPINVYTRSDSAGAAEMWSLFSGGKTQEDLKGTAVNGDPGLAEAVRQDPLAVGFNNVGFTFDPATGLPNEGLLVIPIDSDGDGVISEEENFYGSRDEFTAAVAEGKYPFPPARVLYLVTKGEPSPAIAEFYRWVLTEGQAFVQDAGYVKLTDAQLQESLGKLGE
jgi:phosphate transport system substrate-binding protein